MDEALFGTPVDQGFLAVREAPETPLVVYPMAQGTQAHVFVAQPASWPALSESERLALAHYFQWEEAESHWWRTLRPAVVSLERITPAIWAAHLVEQGIVVRAGDDPASVPPDVNIFRTCRSIPAPTIRDPLGPTLCPDLSGVTEVLRAPALRIVRAIFPAFGSEAVWLRVFEPGEERKARSDALSSELECLRTIAVREPKLVAEILHEGMLETAFHHGRYVAFRPVKGLAPGDAIAIANRFGFPRAQSIVRDTVLSVAKVMRVGHESQLCLGPLSPSLLRLRPGANSGDRINVRFIALPGAGRLGGVNPPSTLELFREGTSSRLLDQFAQANRRSLKSDLAAFGILIQWLLDESPEKDPELLAFAGELAGGGMKHIADVVSRLLELAPDRG